MRKDFGIIIGGGPAGLSVGRELKERGIPFLVLEQGPAVGTTFRSMAANTSYGPWINNVLPASNMPRHSLVWRVHREQYAQYLSEYAISHDLPVRTGVHVEGVRREDGRFLVDIGHETLEASFIINATGYFSNPNVPRYPGAEQSLVPQIHAASYREPATVREILGKNRGRVLIVGKRLTAGETMESLVRAGYTVALSHRTPIEFQLSELKEACLSPFTFLWEELQRRIPRAQRPFNLDVKMRGGVQRRLLTSGQVASYPDIKFFRERTVVFEDGREEEFDLVIYATGYRPALKHLAGLLDLSDAPKLQGFESAEVPGLFFMGLIGLNSFRSQFLRGIREDAPLVAAEVQRFLAAQPARVERIPQEAMAS